jgi:hypothetical protein
VDVVGYGCAVEDGFVVSPSNAGASASVAGSGPPIPKDPHELPIDEPLLQPLPQATSRMKQVNSIVPNTRLQRRSFIRVIKGMEMSPKQQWLKKPIRQGIRFVSAGCQRHPLP